MILLSSPLKNDPLETTVSIFFFLEIEIFTTKVVNSKGLKKNLSSAFVDVRWTSLSMKFVSPESLLSTSAAASFHSLYVYHQVQVWRDQDDLDPELWVWAVKRGTLAPVLTSKAPAPASLLKLFIRNCKKECRRCSMYLFQKWAEVFSHVRWMSRCFLFQLSRSLRSRERGNHWRNLGRRRKTG